MTHLGSGKVRELFSVGNDRLLLVTSDRISAYDVVMSEAIPDKGKVLTGLSHFWFGMTRSICPNHMISVRVSEMPDVGIGDLAGRAMLCRRADPLAIEFVVRGYLSGSGWREYKASGAVCGHELPAGLVEGDELPEPILTPATKAVGGHDENITEEAAAGIVGAADYDTAKAYALQIYDKARAYCLEKGIVLADTKFEFGRLGGEVILIDEALTPDSSRFWPQDRYEPGGPQVSFDKQYLRDWLDSTGWDHSPPPPALPHQVVAATRSRYVEAYETLTGHSLGKWLRGAAG